MKNARLEADVKANHLSYIGDAHVGEHVNIGAGTITCNYDGFAKHRTEIGAGAFIGSDSALRCAGGRSAMGAYRRRRATLMITEERGEADALALGRARQVTKPGRAEQNNRAQNTKRKNGKRLRPCAESSELQERAMSHL